MFTPENAKRLGAKGSEMRSARTKVETYLGRPLDFIRQLVDPETKRPFVLYPAQERFLAEVLTLDGEGRAPYPEAIYSAPKKSGKTTLAALALIYLVRVAGGRYAEGYCVANDLEQATGRVFRQVKRIITASPLLRSTARLLKERVEFKATGGTIQAIGQSYASAAGVNPTVSVFDELWAYTSERSHRLWDELVPVPTRAISLRLTTTYAGFEGESDLLEGLYTRGLTGEVVAPDLYRLPDLLMFWTHSPVAPWQTERWLTQMRGQLRVNAYLRMIENRFVSSESGFVPPEWWAACEDATLRPVVADREMPVWVGVDASVKRDSTALVAVTWDRAVKRVRLVWHRVFQPSPADPLDFEATIERELLALRTRFAVRRIWYDPYQLVSSAQRLTRAGLPMVEFPQTVPNLTEASQQLYDLIKGRNLTVYVDEELRSAVHQAVALEGSRGWRIAKQKAVHKIDLVVALAQACLGGVKGHYESSSVGVPVSITRADAIAARETVSVFDAPMLTHPWSGARGPLP